MTKADHEAAAQKAVEAKFYGGGAQPGLDFCAKLAAEECEQNGDFTDVQMANTIRVMRIVIQLERDIGAFRSESTGRAAVERLDSELSKVREAYEFHAQRKRLIGDEAGHKHFQAKADAIEDARLELFRQGQDDE